ncbi:MAG: hypothetical protein Sapg2KO_46430 [Saprospiraceae bacterium]
MANLQKAFDDLVQRYSTSLDVSIRLWEELEVHYQAKGRFYHNLHHLEMLLKELVTVEAQVKDWDSLLWALFYHDLVYDPQRKDNEAQSAEYLRLILEDMDYPTTRIDTCVGHILATKFHEGKSNPDTNYFVDADLSILGQTPTIYDQYTQQIRQEYQIFSDEIYQAGRQRVIQHFLNMDRIFKSDFFFEKYEKQSRENIKRELEDINLDSRTNFK